MYTNAFYDWVADNADASAQVILPIVQDVIAPTSVVDYGCARGHWLRVWETLGVQDVMGFDGPHVQPSTLVIQPGSFAVADLRTPPAAPRRFSLAMCLEVAEHLPRATGPALVAVLCGAADAVLFSAAFPGQGGDGHVNERPLTYWASLFAQHGYVPLDVVRRAVLDDGRVAPWYRSNVLLFVNRAHLSSLPALARRFLTDPLRVPVLTPIAMRARALVLRPLPEPIVTALSGLRSRWHAARAKRQLRPD